jgi:hypothetical protein
MIEKTINGTKVANPNIQPKVMMKRKQINKIIKLSHTHTQNVSPQRKLIASEAHSFNTSQDKDENSNCINRSYHHPN